MAEDRYQLAVIIASVRKGRLGPAIASWFLRQAEARGDSQIDVIDLAELNLPVDLSGGDNAEMFAKRIAIADAIIVVTPEYNHGYPGGLKIAIDTVRDEWRAKPVGFVCYGGISGGLRAVEQLRTVFAELQAATVRNTVSLRHAYDLVADGGDLSEPEHAAAAAGALLTQIGWWARTLRHGRAVEPVPN